MLFLETKYVTLLSYRLEKFHQTSDRVWAFRCPYCGDSQKKRKTRGYIYERGGHLYFYCHNCSFGRSFVNFLKDQDNGLFLEFIKERFEVRRPLERPDPDFSQEAPIFKLVVDLPPLATLPQSHPARVFVQARKIPEIWEARMYYTEKFFAWARTHVPEKYQNVPVDEPRIVIPFLSGFQGRALHNRGVKYINVTVDKNRPFLFGLDWLDEESLVYALEGPFDAMFLPNGIASGGGDVIRELAALDRPVAVVYDNEPRNPHTVKKMMKAAKQGFPVCVWPQSFGHKDINDMVLAGISPENIKEIIERSVVCGFEAEVNIANWMRCSV